MKIARTNVYRFFIPFAAPVKIGKDFLHNREGFVVVLTDDAGRHGYGEIAPLPGFDKTKPERCFQDISSLQDLLNNASLKFDLFDLTASLFGAVDISSSSWTNHTMFGVECALVGLYLQHCGAGFAAVSPLPEEPLRIPVNGLFIPEAADDKVDLQIRRFKNSGVTTIKIKIGRLPAEDEIRQILSFVDGVGAEVSFRLDGNRNLTLADYRRYHEALSHLPVEYVEEPLAEENMQMAGDVPWPLALDESLTDLLDPEEPSFAGLGSAVRAVILKPGLLSGLHGMARAVGNAKQAGIQTIFSSAFNTGITLANLGVFSRLAGLPPGTAHGLDTLRYLADDVLLPSPTIQEGMLAIPGGLLFGGASLNEKCLREEIR